MLIIGLSVLAGAAALVLGWELGELALKRRRFSGRTALGDNDLARLFATNGLSDHEVLTVLSVISRATRVPRSMLRPGDRFDAELSPVRGLSFDDGIHLLNEAIAKEMNIQSEDVNIYDEKTVAGLLVRISSCWKR